MSTWMQFSSIFFILAIVILLAMEPRQLTRADCHKFARKAYNMGIRYIGGCCGFEPYHIRALAEEVSYMEVLAHSLF